MIWLSLSDIDLRGLVTLNQRLNVDICLYLRG